MASCDIVMISQAEYPKRFELLKGTLLSLRKHTQYPFKLTVVDNGPVSQTDYLKTQTLDQHIVNKVNMGMGCPRNQGAQATDGEYLTFIDNDLLFHDGWLSDSIEILKKYPKEKIIVAPMRTIPMKKVRNQVGVLDSCTLWARAGSRCLVFRRKDFEVIGLFSSKAESGREYGIRAVQKGYSYLLLKQPKVRHIGRTRTWKRKSTLREGVWVV